MPVAGADDMVLTECSLTGATNEVTDDGTAGAEKLTIIAMVNGTLKVVYDMDTYTVSVEDASSDSGWDISDVPTNCQAGQTFTFTLTQQTAGAYSNQNPTVTLTGLANGYTTALATEGVAEANATYETVQFTNEELFKAAVATGKLYTDNQNNEADGTLATDDDYQASHDFYLLKTAYVAPVKAVVTVTVTMPNEAVAVTDITVA